MATLFDTSYHYVKFVRGSVQAWEKLLQTPQNINDDTLYFIYESGDNVTEGKLYLGKKLISGVGGTSEIASLNDLQDIIINNLGNKNLLVYNDNTKKWENASLESILQDVGEMTGATLDADGKSGLVPTPTRGASNRFLRVDGTWTPINVPTFNTEVFTLNGNEVNLAGYNLATVGSIPIKTEDGIKWSDSAVGKLNRKIVTKEQLLALRDSGELDPDYIYMVAKEDSSSSDNYDEYMSIEGQLEKLGSFGEVNLTDYVKVTTFETRVGALEDALNDKTDTQGTVVPGLVSRVNNIELNYVKKSEIGDLTQLTLYDGNNNLVDQVNSLTSDSTEIVERLKWHELQI